LLDFGVAKLSDTSLTPAGTVVGTPSYMSPEQIRGAKLDGGTDIFSFGVVAFEILTGVRPFPGTDFTTVVSNIIHKEPLTFEEVGTDLDSRLEQVLIKALSKERSERFNSAFEFVDAMAEVYSVGIDNSGLVGGYDSDSSFDDLKKDSARTSDSSYTNGISGMPHTVTESKGGDLKTDSAAIPVDSSEPGTNQPIDEAETLIEESKLDPLGTSAGGLRQNNVPLYLAALLIVLVVVGYYGQSLSAKQARNGTSTKVVDGQDVVEIVVENQEDIVKPPTESPKLVKADDEIITSPEYVLEEPGFEKLKPSKLILALERIETKNEQFVPLLNEAVRRKQDVLSDAAKKRVQSISDAELTILLSSTANADIDLLRIAISVAATRDDSVLLSPLLALLDHIDYLVRATTLKALGGAKFGKDGSALEAVSKLLNSDPEYLVRGFAAKYLGQTKDPGMRKVLKDRLKVETNEVVVKMIKKSLSALES